MNEETLNIGRQRQPAEREGTITVVGKKQPNGGYLTRITQADPHVRISLHLLELAQDGAMPCMRVEDGWLYLSDDYAHQSCYRLGDLDDTGRARWMEKL